MPIHDWTSNLLPSSTHHTDIPHGMDDIPTVRQLSDADGRHPMDGSEFLAYPYYIEEYVSPGFRALDEAMKQYFSGLRVPTKESYRFMRVKIAGGDKSLMTWADDLKEGRVKIPVAAIDRQGVEFNPEKFSYPYLGMTTRYLNSSGTMAARVYRPVPFLINYSIIIWAEHKRDMECILFQILPRFNPLAEFRMFDGHIVGNVQLRFGGATDASDKELGHDQKANVRYEISIVAEAWLPLPEKILPTVIGRVNTISERQGEILVASTSNVVSSGSPLWFEPIQTQAQARDII